MGSTDREVKFFMLAIKGLRCITVIIIYPSNNGQTYEPFSHLTTGTVRSLVSEKHFFFVIGYQAFTINVTNKYHNMHL